MKYLFVYKDGTWWLKIKTVEELLNYHDKTDGRWSGAFDNLIHSKEFYDGEKHASNLAYVIGMFGSKRGLNAVESVVEFKSKIFDAQMDLILEGHTLFINEKGGYHFDYNGDKPASQFIYRNEFVFPNFSKDEIRVKSFPGGHHFYAFIGDMQVRDGDMLKWNTYEAAMKVAESVVTRA